MPLKLFNEPSPLETKVLSKRFGLDNSETMDCYLANDGCNLGKIIAGTGFDFDLYTHSGAGAYECGEEPALLDSLEGKRGVPRMKPPFPAVAGAWASPTLLNNVETFSAIPTIILNGGKAFADLGTPKNGGTRLVCISGHVNKPGVYELPLGYPMMKAINEVAGGIPHGRKLKAVFPGGSSRPL